MLKKILAMFSLAFVFSLPVVVLKIIDLYKDPLARSGKQYVDGLLPVLCASWDRSAFLKESSPEFRAQLENPARWDNIEHLSETLGPLKEYGGSEGRIFFPWITDASRGVVGSYRVKGNFQRKQVDLRVVIVLRDGKWRLISFGEYKEPAKNDGRH